MPSQIQGIHGFSIDELKFLQTSLGFANNYFAALSHSQPLKQQAKLNLYAILNSGIDTILNNHKNLDFSIILAKVDKLTESDFIDLKKKFDKYSLLPKYDWSSGVMVKISEVERFIKTGLVFETILEEVAA